MHQETQLVEKRPTKEQSIEEEHDTEDEGKSIVSSQANCQLIAKKCAGSEDEDSVTEDDENDSDFDIQEAISGVKGKRTAKSDRDNEKAKPPDTQILKDKASDVCKPELKSEKV